MASLMSLKKEPSGLKKTSHLRRFFVFYFLILLGVIIYFGMFWFSGNIFKKHYVETIKIISSNTKTPIKIAEYHQGFFSSSAKLFISQPLMEITIDQQIDHGPWVTDPTTDSHTLAAAVVQSQIHFHIKGMNFDYTLMINTIGNYNNTYETWIDAPALTYSNPMVKISWQGAKGHISFAIAKHKMSMLSTDITLNPSALQTEQNQFQISATKIQSNLSYSSMTVWNGTEETVVPSVTINNASHGLYTINNFKNVTTFGVTSNNLYSHTLQISADQLTTPLFILRPLQLKFSLFGVNAKNLNQLHKDMLQPTQTQQDSLTKMQMMQNDYLSILTPATALMINGLSNTDFGSLSLNMNAKMNLPSNITLPISLDQFKQYFLLQLNIRVPIGFVNHLFDFFNKKMQAEMPPTPVETTEPTLAGLIKQINQLADDDKMSIFIKIRLTDMLNGNPDPDEFSNYVDQLVTRNEISKETADLLKSRYTLIAKITKNQDKQNSIIPPPDVLPQTPPVDPLRSQLNNAIAQGWIQQDKTDYVMTVTVENGQMQVNGKPIVGVK